MIHFSLLWANLQFVFLDFSFARHLSLVWIDFRSIVLLGTRAVRSSSYNWGKSSNDLWGDGDKASEWPLCVGIGFRYVAH